MIFNNFMYRCIKTIFSTTFFLYIVSTTKIEKTGFKPTYSLDFGIQELIKTFTILGDKKYSNV